jgi:hypothetical protein
VEWDGLAKRIDYKREGVEEEEEEEKEVCLLQLLTFFFILSFDLLC